MLTKLVKLGIFVVVCVLLTVYIGAKIANFDLGSKYHLTATFGDVTGMRSGDPVRLGGVPVGKVSRLKLVDGRAHVGFDVKSSIKLPVDTRVAVAWRNLIGQRFLALVPGQSAQLLKNGDQINLTTSVVDLNAFVNRLGPLAASINPQQLNNIFTALSQAFNGNIGNSNSLVADLNGILATLSQRNQTIGQLITDYKTITGTLATRDKQIQTMVDNVVLLSQAFFNNTQLVDNSLVQLSGLSSGLNTLLTRSGSQLKGAVDNLSVVVNVLLRERIADLAQALHDLPPALQALFSISSQGHYIAVTGICASLTPGCPYPVSLDKAAGTTTSQSASPGTAALSSAPFLSLLAGGH
jgi:phospholipid/cholesterol/gamma-HCH transport system substrate-binding protein